MPPLRDKELDLNLGSYSGIAFKQTGMTFGRMKNKPLEVTVYVNEHGTFEASVQLTVDDAESIREWLTEFIISERK